MKAELVELLKRLESFQANPYFDYKGYSIGYGHFVGKNKSDWTGGTLTKSAAHDLLLADITKVESQVGKYFSQNLSENQLAAITFWAFNFGSNRLKEATFVKLINENGGQSEIETWWRKWNKAGGTYKKGLEQRRIMETDIFFGREVRLPDYIGGGTLTLTDTQSQASSTTTTSTTTVSTTSEPYIVPKKAFPILPIAGGFLLIGAAGGYVYYQKKKRKSLNGFLPYVPFWAKAAIAGGVILIAGAAYTYAKPKALPYIADNTPTYTQIPEQTMSAELVNNYKLLSISVGDLSIENVVDSLPKHKSKKYKSRKLDALTHIVIHHTAGNANESVEDIANYHIKSTKDKFPGIGYHFVIYPNGRVFQTNYLTVISWHVAEFNTGCIGISFPGNFDINHNVPTDAQIVSGKKLVLALQSAIEKAIGRKLLVKGHKEVAQKGHSTACPGRYFPLDTFHNL